MENAIGRIEFIKSRHLSGERLQKLWSRSCPWATRLTKVKDGYMAFKGSAEFEAWKNKRR